MSTRTITLTGRRPVRINDDNWPVIASVLEEDHDGQVRYQANQISNWWIKVRQHEDGRAIVSAGYSCSTNWQNGRDLEHKHGAMLPAGTTMDDIYRAIESVVADMTEGEHNGDDGSRWSRLGAECIADLPAEELP